MQFYITPFQAAIVSYKCFHAVHKIIFDLHTGMLLLYITSTLYPTGSNKAG